MNYTVTISISRLLAPQKTLKFIRGFSETIRPVSRTDNGRRDPTLGPARLGNHPKLAIAPNVAHTLTYTRALSISKHCIVAIVLQLYYLPMYLPLLREFCPV